MELGMKKLIRRVPVLYHLGKRLQFRYRAFKGSFQLKRRLKSVTVLKVVVGAAGVFDEGWIPTDVEYLNLVDARHWERYFRPNSLDAILAEHVWEHLTAEEAVIAARHCYEYLKSGGYLRVAVPDGLHPDPQYIEWVKVGGIGSGAYSHKMLYTYETLRDVFARAGFAVRLLEYYDRQGQFHFVDWDPARGTIHRSRRSDARNRDGVLRYTSIILDAYKNA
jgi:predicted SAM-dependent methyltransferase